MNIHNLMAIALAVSSVTAFAKTGESKDAALEEIKAVASSICTTIPLKGDNGSVTLSTQAKGELRGILGKLLSKLSDLKLKGGAEYSKQSFQNVLQEDLVQAISASNDCKLAVLNVLKGKLLPEVKNSGQSVGSVNATGAGSGAIGINNGTVNIGGTTEPKK